MISEFMVEIDFQCDGCLCWVNEGQFGYQDDREPGDRAYCSEACLKKYGPKARTHYRNGDERRTKTGNCDSCQCVFISGILCHETGCPDAWKDKLVECKGCGCEFYPEDRGQKTCQSCTRLAEQWELLEDPAGQWESMEEF